MLAWPTGYWHDQERAQRKGKNMLKKRYLSNDKICKVVFILPRQFNAQKAVLVGDFNNWDKDATPMRQNKDGTWKANVRLEAGQEY
jgi:1,4-alpha-glucan branching enzyme